MNVTSIRKALAAGQWPDRNLAVILLRENQVKHLAATVPCVKIRRRANTSYYFPGAKAKLDTVYHGGVRGTLEGTLINVGDCSVSHCEDGTPCYVMISSEVNGMPVVFTSLQEALRLRLVYEASLWMNRKPYRVSVDGYESVYEKGWPKDESFGAPKMSLSIRDGDYRSFYLSIDPIPTDGTCEDQCALHEAIVSGRFDGSLSTEAFTDIVAQEVSQKRARFNRRFDFEQFVRKGPVQQLNMAVKTHNQEVEACKAFLKLARDLRRHMRKNPGWYRRINPLPEGSSLKSSQLFYLTEEITRIHRSRADSFEGWTKVERATRT